MMASSRSQLEGNELVSVERGAVPLGPVACPPTRLASCGPPVPRVGVECLAGMQVEHLGVEVRG